MNSSDISNYNTKTYYINDKHVTEYVDLQYIDESFHDKIMENNIENCQMKMKQLHPLKQELCKIRRLLCFFRCGFYQGINRRTLIINYCVWFCAFVFHLYAIILTIYLSVTLKLNNKSLLFMMVRCFTSLQSILSMIFTLYWQRKGKFNNYVYVLHEVQQSLGCKKYQKNIGTIIKYLYIIVAITIVFCSMMTFFQIFDIHIDIVNPKLIYTMQKSKLTLIYQFIFMVYASVCTSVSMFLYCLFTYAAVLEVRFFNERIDAIGEDKQKSIVEELIILITDHAKLSEAIRNLDSMCEIFAFLMIGCTIPITVFTTLQLLSTKGLPLINLTVALPLFLFCIILLTGLTAIPSQAYTVLERSKHHLYSNLNIWENFDKKVFQIANSLASHLNQPDLGVSVWGFALISKPLILTTISVMVTCMAFLLELRKKPTI